MNKWYMTFQMKDLLTSDNSNEYAQQVGMEVAKRLRTSKIKNLQTVHEYDVDDIAEEFDKVGTCNEFNAALARLYDYADDHRIWIG